MKNNNYDKRIFRLIYTLNKLDNGTSICTKELAKEFNVSTRTIQRDIELLNMAGFPITPESKGKYGFFDGFSLKRIMLTNEEASLLTIMCDVTNALGSKFVDSFDSIRNKILSVNNCSNYFVKLSKSKSITNRNETAGKIENSITKCKKINIKYKKISDGKEKSYLIKPLKIIFFDGFWYLMAHTENHNFLVKFRLDNILKVTATNEDFILPKNIKYILDESINIFFSEKREKRVKLHIDKKVSSYFKKKDIFPRQNIVSENKNGNLKLETFVDQFIEIIPIIFNWIPYIKVIEPTELKATVEKTIGSYYKTIKN